MSTLKEKNPKDINSTSEENKEKLKKVGTDKSKNRVDFEDGFICNHCGKFIPFKTLGTKHRNHCPWCLWSKHVSLKEHDRKSHCHGLMKPIGISIKNDGEWNLIHRCISCGLIRTNRIAGDDDELMLLCLALNPLTNLPFPIDILAMYKNHIIGDPKISNT